ncbi:Alpha/Beta hydrolase protein [Biscogniauxia mediterranea]|nr:Alpha/Beta hydrolase protein [Biscogniauxia mediterranea]
MAPVTELIHLTLKPDTDRAALLSSIEEKLRSAGAKKPLRAQHGFTHEDPLKLRLALDWADIPIPAPSASASSLLRSLLAAVDDAVAAPRNNNHPYYYVAFEPPRPPVLDDRVVEMVHMYFPPARRGAADVDGAVARFVAEMRTGTAEEKAVEGFSGEAAWGWVVGGGEREGEGKGGLLPFKGEGCAAFVLCLGWESVQAHMRFRDTEEFQRCIPLIRGIEGLKGSEMAHSANLSDTVATSFENVIRFERSQFANGGPYEDDFYVVPPLSNSSGSLKPGVLLKVQLHTDTSTFALAPNTALSRILYTTTNFNGTVIPASAFVLWPFVPRHAGNGTSSSGSATSSAPVVLWAHGTSGFFPGAAPSTHRALWYGDAAPFALALAGYAVVAPDYAGLGVRAGWDGRAIPHQYLNSPAGARDALYALRAAWAAFPGRLSDDYVVMGHSQGGGVAWGVAELLASDAPAFAADLGPGYLGTIAGSPTTDLFTGTSAFIVPWVGMMLPSIFPDFDLGAWLTPAGAARLALFREVEGQVGAWEQLALLEAEGLQIVRDGYDRTSWYARAYAALANAGRRAFRGPLMVLQGTADVYVPYNVTSATVGATCPYAADGGELLEYVVVNGTGHVPTLDAARQLWLQWIEDRFEGKPVARSGCVQTYVQSFLPLEQYQATGTWFEQWAGSAEYSYQTILGL